MKKGDTLIEVAIAIAIFSLVAIGVVSVVNGSTSAAQNALEVTVTREEIDAQAEALRYIHNSYIAGGRSNSADNEKYRALWDEIKSHGDHTDEVLNSILNYNPSTCSELYDTDLNNPNSIYTQKAFIINTHYLGNPIDYTTTASLIYRNEYQDNTIFAAANHVNNFGPAATFPRILYQSNVLSQDSLLDQSGNDTGMLAAYYYDEVNTAEGLYIIAVKDQDTTAIINSGSNIVRYESAFYDFYIRSCWFAPGAERPSTISTVIRLQDPESINNYNENATPVHEITFHKNDGSDDVIIRRPATSELEISSPTTFTRLGYRLAGWSTSASATTATYPFGGTVPVSANAHYYAVWEPTSDLVSVVFHSNYPGYNVTETRSRERGIRYNPQTDTDAPHFERDGRTPNCWSLSAHPTDVTDCAGEITLSGGIDLYAYWEEEPESFDLTITLDRTDHSKDLDAYFEILGLGKVYYGHPQIVHNDTVVILSDDIKGNNTGTEVVTATNLKRDQVYYFYVKNYTDAGRSGNVFAGTGATVTVNGTTFSVSNASGTGPYWNVFKVMNGQIITRNTITASPETGY